MTEERLQEIKDSVEFQYALAKAQGVDNALLFTNEEEELIEEVERLHSIIKEVREYIEENMSYIEKGKLEYIPSGEELLQILDKVEEK